MNILWNIFTILTIFLLALGMFKCIVAFSDTSLNSKYSYLILIFIYSLIYNSIYKIIPSEIGTSVAIIFISLITIFYLKLNLKDWIFYLFVVWIIGILIDVALMLIIETINIWNFVPLDDLKILSSFVMAILFLIISKSKFAKENIRKIYSKYNKINFSFIKILILLGIYIFVDILCLQQLQSNNNLILLYLICLISGMLVIINYIVKVFQLWTLKETVSLLTKNNEFYINIINDYRIMKHNLINKLLGLKSVPKSKVKILVDDLINEYANLLSYTENIRDIPVGINGIIYEKIYNSKEKINISIQNNVKSNLIECLTPRNYNSLCEVLGLVLDNAILATGTSEEKLLAIQIREEAASIEITIINSFKGQIDLEELGKINYTTKDKGHGLGLYSILRKKTKVEISIKNNLFINKISVRKIKKEA